MADSEADEHSLCIQHIRRSLPHLGCYTFNLGAQLPADSIPHTSVCENVHHAWYSQEALELNSCSALDISSHTLSAILRLTTLHSHPLNLANSDLTHLGSVSVYNSHQAV